MRYVLIPLTDTALSVGAVAPDGESGNLSDGERQALARALEGTLQTCELLVTYTVGVAGKPSRQ
jgi:hypothetical protein